MPSPEMAKELDDGAAHEILGWDPRSMELVELQSAQYWRDKVKLSCENIVFHFHVHLTIEVSRADYDASRRRLE